VVGWGSNFGVAPFTSTTRPVPSFSPIRAKQIFAPQPLRPSAGTISKMVENKNKLN